MVAALTYLGVSVTVLFLLTFVYVVEDIKGERVFLAGLRTKLDHLFGRVVRLLASVRAFFTHGFVRLLIHYGVHKMLKHALAALRGLEKRVEELVRRNRTVAKTIKAEKERNHLSALAEHKEEHALSNEEKEQLRSR